MRITVKQLKQLIKEAVKESYEPLDWNDYFSSDRESGHEDMIDSIMDKLRQGKSLSKDEVDALESELSGERHELGLKGSDVFQNKDRRGF